MNIFRNTFTINMAGFYIKIKSISPRTCILCMNYLCDEDVIPDIQVEITEDDILLECSGKIGNSSKLISAENFAVYRKIVESLLDYSFLLMHGAVVAVGNSAYMFSAPSGTGKTTHIRKWLHNIEDSIVVNGDKPLIKIEEKEIIACGTPWAGYEHMNTNVMVPLKAIAFLERSENNDMQELSFSQAYPYLIQQTHIPSDPQKARKTLELLSQLCGKLKFYKFRCNNFKNDCFEVAYNTLVGGGGAEADPRLLMSSDN